MAQKKKSTIYGWGLIGLGCLCAVLGITEIPGLMRVLRLIPQAAANPGWLVLGLVIAGIGVIVARGKASNLLWPLVALVLLLAYNLFFSRTFFDLKVNYVNDQAQFYGSLVYVMKWGSIVMLLALGMTLVIATGGIDLSVGAVIAIAGCVAGSLIQPGPKSLFVDVHIGHMPFVVLGVVLLAGLLCGAWNGALVSVFKIQPIIATLILMIAGRGLAQLITGGDKPTYGAYPVLDYIGKGFLLGMPVQVWLVLGAAILTLLLTRATALGLFIESIGNNAPAAELAGINAKWVRFLAYAFTGVCAASAGLMKAAELRYPDYDAGKYSELDAIVAVAIGGTSLVGGRFTILGSLLGAFIMQALRTTILSNSDNPPLNLVIQAAVVLVICLLQSEALRSWFAKIYKRFVRPGRAAVEPGGEGAK